jgi:hypothetical protein
MKKLIAIASLVAILTIMTPALADVVTTYTIPVSPMGPGNSAPQAFMIWRGFDIGVNQTDVSINPTSIRDGFYAFTGEKIYYYVLVRDDNGAADINQVSWVTNAGTQQEGPCSAIQVSGTGANTYICVGKTDIDPLNCTKLGLQKVYINQATNLLFDDQTDKIFQCVLTVEQPWSGTNTIQVNATDQSGAPGSTLPE